MNKRFLIVAGYAPSLLGFRLPLIVALQQAGMEVHVAAPGSSADDQVRAELHAKGLILHDIVLQRAGTNLVTDLKSLWSLWRLMRRLRPQYTLSYTIKPVIYGSLAAWLARVPHRFALITGLGHAFQEGKGRGGLRLLAQQLYAIALARVEKVFFQNPDDRNLFVQRRVLAAKVASCVVNGSGVDLEEFPVRPLPQGGPHFLFMARLMVPKGIREYAEAARMVRAQHPSARFVVLGDFDDNPESIARAELDGWIEDDILHYAGHVNDVRPIIAECNVFVLPSYYPEGTPHSSLEAMSMGRAVITADSPGCRETVVDGENGFLVSVKSIEELAQAMLRFVNSPDLVQRMGARSRQIAEEKFDVHKVNATMLKEMGIQCAASVSKK